MSIRHFSEMTVWQESKKLVLLVYEYTKDFPPEERYVLTAQMKRAAISVSSNIAEGFGRKTAPDKEHFYVMSAGSLTELENHILISQELQYDVSKKAPILLAQVTIVSQLLHGLLRAHRNKT